MKGFRYISIFVDLDDVLPPKADSTNDIALLRAANLALQRKQQGYQDTFLFITPMAEQIKIEGVIQKYGFPKADIIRLDYDKIEFQSITHQEIGEDIELSIKTWLAEKHPETISFSESPYALEPFWWTGIEYDSEQNSYSWPFMEDKFRNHLPYSQRNRLNIWLAILAYALDIEPDPLEYDIVSQDKAAALLATLCEWLHGFEAASGFNWNDFCHTDFASEIGPSGFFLGFETASLISETLDELAEKADERYEIDGIIDTGFKLITEHLRSPVSRELSNFFGGDTALFWALYSSVYPKFETSMKDTINGIFSLEAAGYGEISDAWEFVSNGWSDKADNL